MLNDLLPDFENKRVIKIEFREDYIGTDGWVVGYQRSDRVGSVDDIMKCLKRPDESESGRLYGFHVSEY